MIKITPEKQIKKNLSNLLRKLPGKTVFKKLSNLLQKPN